MSTPSPIPAFMPIALPAPVWLLKTLLVVGFYFHAIPMNVALIGGVIAAIFILYGQKKHHQYALRLGHTLAYSLPYFLSVAITQGIVPLLFIQLLYGPLFYTSSVIIAVPWLILILLLLLGYTGYYIYNFKRQSFGHRVPWILIAVTFLFLWIAFFFSNNTTLMLTPERWLAMYEHSPQGLNLNLDEAQLIPRYLHFIVAAIAVTGLVVGCFGWYWTSREQDYGAWLVKTGAKLFLWPTLLQIPVGIWFMLALPSRFMMNFLGREPIGTGLFMSALGLDLIGLISMAVAAKSGRVRFFQIGMFAALIVIFLMIVMRHMLREYYTQPFYNTAVLPVEPQWLMIGIFGASALALVIYMTWLLRLLWRAFHPSPTA